MSIHTSTPHRALSWARAALAVAALCSYEYLLAIDQSSKRHVCTDSRYTYSPTPGLAVTVSYAIGEYHQTRGAGSARWSSLCLVAPHDLLTIPTTRLR